MSQERFVEVIDLGKDGSKWKHGYIPENAAAVALKSHHKVGGGSGITVHLHKDRAGKLHVPSNMAKMPPNHHAKVDKVTPMSRSVDEDGGLMEPESHIETEGQRLQVPTRMLNRSNPDYGSMTDKELLDHAYLNRNNDSGTAAIQELHRRDNNPNKAAVRPGMTQEQRVKALNGGVTPGERLPSGGKPVAGHIEIGGKTLAAQKHPDGHVSYRDVNGVERHLKPDSETGKDFKGESRFAPKPLQAPKAPKDGEARTRVTPKTYQGVAGHIIVGHDTKGRKVNVHVPGSLAEARVAQSRIHNGKPAFSDAEVRQHIKGRLSSSQESKEGPSATRIKLLEGNLASFQRQLAFTSNKDQVRRQIAATKELLRQEKAK